MIHLIEGAQDSFYLLPNDWMKAYMVNKFEIQRPIEQQPVQTGQWKCSAGAAVKEIQARATCFTCTSEGRTEARLVEEERRQR